MALRLGLTSFGGPVAHLGYFRREYVEQRRWLSDAQYAELVAVAQFLPGPASSQVGMAVGYHAAGWRGAVAAWLGFTAPSALVLALLGALAAGTGLVGSGVVAGLKIVAVAVVADAVLGMAGRLIRGWGTALIGASTMGALLLTGNDPRVQIGAIVVGGAAASLWIGSAAEMRPAAVRPDAPEAAARAEAVAAGAGGIRAPSHRSGAALLISAGTLLAVALAVAGAASPASLLGLGASMIVAGSLVFGGGHVVLPLLESSLVPDALSQDAFLAGYGFAQAVPGPLFTFATYVGQVVAGTSGAVLATIAIFLPGALLMLGVLPFWASVRRRTAIGNALVGVNAAVVGILAAALWNPIISTSLTGPVHIALAVGLFALLRWGNAPPWALLMLGCAAGGVLL